MIKHEWIPIDKLEGLPENLGKRFLLSDEYGCVYVGSTAFDYYDAMYWFPMPEWPMNSGVITNDEWTNLVFKDENGHCCQQRNK